MRRSSPILAMVGFLALHGVVTSVQAAPQLGWHYAGHEAVLGANPESVWSSVSQVKPASAFSNQIKSRVAAWLPRMFGWEAGNPAGATPFVRQFLDDVLNKESLAHVVGDSIGQSDWALAVNVGGDGEAVWTSALLKGGRQFAFGEPRSFESAGLKGWTFQTDTRPGFSFITGNGWVIVANQFQSNSQAAQWLSALGEKGRPAPALGEPWLAVELTPSLIDWEIELPVVGGIESFVASCSWQGASIRTDLTATLADDTRLEVADWSIPREEIFDPLVSFTALRGAQDWLGSFAAIEALPSDLRPNQVFNWTRGDVALMSEFALPVSDSKKAYGLLKQVVPEKYGKTIMDRALGQWISATNETRMLWRGLPLFVPYFEPLAIENDHFVKGGVFPLKRQEATETAPSALFEQFEGREELFYYDWEITAARIHAFRQGERFFDLVFNPKPAQESTHGVEWMSNVFAKLENSITEASLGEANTINVVRKSALGVTGIELWMLAHWLDGQEFPSFPYQMPKSRSANDGTAAGKTRPLPRAQPVNR